ncbi:MULTISPECIES: ABC transporter permease [Vibrio]|uniref:ABC transporter permease n=1 Tax=Vibrio mediterranei TaxID=689 RepID=A0A2S9ZS82_9VIBR|nr:MULTISPECIES: iron chelate uptake ABC transporter family permease subunit [Vibrio]AYV23439.1 ABC transporter permease [Vibrio mediterranei]EDL54719.1 catechol siderophore ABC transporter, permease protein [Vibrio mediterranei AK1]MCG9625356.1 iron chelate uptake ABC transporter family permease subunit [Vibrio mediterranei]MCG9659372.1 iron chelate uptake ABC transporter family permease subunit [Vibrio mediterranei]MCG9663887.1 iron chelate uptake ABC transporter family permease subunit [Vib
MTIHKYILACTLLVALAVSSLVLGAAHVSIADLFRGDEHAYSIYVVSRVPRLLAIILAGAGLSVAGLIMQQIVQNRFASPSTTGTIDCALLGYVAGLIFLGGASQWMHLGVIFFFAVAGTLIFVKFLQRLQFKNAVLVPLIGIMYGNVISALTTFIAYKHDLVQTMSSWTVANFASVLQGNYEILYLAVPACVLAYLYARQFSAASVGESFAKNIGLDYQKIVFIGVILVAVSSSTVVMIVGVIPFLGLIVPNIVSLFMGDNMKRILPWTAYWGVILVLACDILGRLIIFPYEMPISMIISIFGGAVFIYLVLRDKANA